MDRGYAERGGMYIYRGLFNVPRDYNAGCINPESGKRRNSGEVARAILAATTCRVKPRAPRAPRSSGSDKESMPELYLGFGTPRSFARSKLCNFNLVLFNGRIRGAVGTFLTTTVFFLSSAVFRFFFFQLPSANRLLSFHNGTPQNEKEKRYLYLPLFEERALRTAGRWIGETRRRGYRLLRNYAHLRSAAYVDLNNTSAMENGELFYNRQPRVRPPARELVRFINGAPSVVAGWHTREMLLSAHQEYIPGYIKRDNRTAIEM